MDERSRFNNANSFVLPGLIALLALAATLRDAAAQERPVSRNGPEKLLPFISWSVVVALDLLDDLLDAHVLEELFAFFRIIAEAGRELPDEPYCIHGSQLTNQDAYGLLIDFT